MYISSHAEVVIKLVPIVNYYIYVNISKYIAFHYLHKIHSKDLPAYYMYTCILYVDTFKTQSE